MAKEQEKTATEIWTASARVPIGSGAWLDLDEEGATVHIRGTYEDIGELRERLELFVHRLKELGMEKVRVVVSSEGLVTMTNILLTDKDAAELVSSMMTLAHQIKMRMERERMTIPEALAHYQETAVPIHVKIADIVAEQPAIYIRDKAIAVFPSPEQYELLDSLHRKSTPGYLTDTLGPYLAAIAEIQNIINEIQGKEHREVVIESIVQQSPISVSLDGASQAVQVVTDTVVPWRRKHAQEMARLATLEKQAEIESKKAEVLEKRARAAKDRAEAGRLVAEAAKQREEAERMKLENEKLRVELHRATIQLALDILAQVAPNLPETEKIAYTVRLLAPLDTIVSSELEISTGK